MEAIKSMSRLVIEMNRPEYNLSFNPNIEYNHFYLESIVVPFVFNNMPEHVIQFYDSLFNVHIITIPAGYYVENSYLNILTDYFNDLDTGGRTYVHGVNPDKTSYIEISLDSFQFVILDNIVQQRTGFIGFLASDAQRITSQKFSYEPKLLLISTNFTVLGQGLYDNIAGPISDQKLSISARSQYTFVTPISSLDLVSNGIISHDYGNNNTGMPITNSRIGSVQIKITDELLMPIDIFPQRLYLTIIFYNK